MALFLYLQLNVTEELTVLLELEFVMHVLWEHMLALELHSVPLVLQGTHVMTPVSLLCPAPLHNIGTMVARFHGAPHALQDTVVTTTPSLQCLVPPGTILFRVMQLVQNVKLARLALILLRHQNTVLVEPTAKRVPHPVNTVLLDTAALLPAPLFPPVCPVASLCLAKQIALSVPLDTCVHHQNKDL